MMLREQLEIFSTKLSIGKPFYAQHVSTACRPCRLCTPLRQHKGHLFLQIAVIQVLLFSRSPDQSYACHLPCEWQSAASFPSNDH